MEPFGVKANQHLAEAQESLGKAIQEMAKDVAQLKAKQESTDERLAIVESENNQVLKRINVLQETVDDLRDSAIRGEIASGQKTKDVAKKFKMTSARVSQIAPRRRYNNG
jgi:chromosome segregation ATPase